MSRDIFREHPDEGRIESLRRDELKERRDRIVERGDLLS
jgi:hypothetical protein